MKKYILPIILFMMFIPFFVNAETCNTDKITIEKIIVESKSGNVEELDKASVNGKNINLNLSMSEIEDNIKYKVVVKNDSNKDYELDKKSFNISSDFIEYTLESEDNSNIVKAKTTKTVSLNVFYKNKVPDDQFESGTYNYNKTITVQLSTGNANTLENPKTGIQSFILILIIFLLVSGSIYAILKKKKYAIFMILIICTVIIPTSVYALCKCELRINSNIRINKSSKVLEMGDYVNFGKYVDIKNNEIVYSSEYTGTNQDVIVSQDKTIPWRVLKIYDDKVDLISDPHSSISLKGALGYNNGVLILNDISRRLYSISSIGIYARSINIKDIEDKYNEEGISSRNNYTENNYQYNVGVSYKTASGRRYYPALYEKENGSGINTNEVLTNGVEQSDPYYSALTNESIKEASIGLASKQTFYDINLDESMDKKYYDVIRGDYITSNNTNNDYWLATRNVQSDLWVWSTCFGIYIINEREELYNQMSTAYLMHNNGSEPDERSNKIRSIVTIPKSLISTDDGNGTINNMYELNI